jgi:hypothetical protein
MGALTGRTVFIIQTIKPFNFVYFRRPLIPFGCEYYVEFCDGDTLKLFNTATGKESSLHLYRPPEDGELKGDEKERFPEYIVKFLETHRKELK